MNQWANDIRIITLSLVSMLSSPAVSAFTIISNAGKPAHWADSRVIFQTYAVPEPFVPAVRASFLSWRETTGASLELEFLGESSQQARSNDGRSTVSWIRRDWQRLPFFPLRSALAVTLSTFDDQSGVITDADIFVNAEYFDWGVAEEPFEDFVDVQNVLTHEVGHVLGLDHSSEDLYEIESPLRDATMFFTSGEGEIKRRSLEESDKLGVESLYPSAPLEAPLLESFEILQQSASQMRVLFRGQGFNDYTSFILTAGSMAIWDRVARYREVISENEVEAWFDISKWSTPESMFVALNSPENLSVMNVSIEISADALSAGMQNSRLQSQSSNGSCSVRASQSPLLMFFAVIGILLILAYRRRFLEILD